jgi:GTP-binding protein
MADHASGGDGEPEGSGENLAFNSDGFSPEQLEAGRKLFASHCEFFYAAQALEHLPEPRGTEVAFAGRSNVGKSSLLNALTGRKALARVSHQPGRTRQLNFFQMEAAPIVLVDMPGYGYAEAPKTEIARWTRVVNTYLKGRPTLRRVLLLIDGRHGVKKTDEPVMKMLDEAAVSYQLVLTKMDKLGPVALPARIRETEAIIAKHVAAHPVLHVTSAEEGTGIAVLRAALAALAEPVPVG